jgi:hypothetical protein
VHRVHDPPLRLDYSYQLRVAVRHQLGSAELFQFLAVALGRRDLLDGILGTIIGTIGTTGTTGILGSLGIIIHFG